MRGGMSNLLERGMAQAPSAPATSNLAPSRNGEHSEHVQCTDDALQSGIRIPAGPGESDPTYGVSETRKSSSRHNPWNVWDVRQYVEDYASGNVRLWQLAAGGCCTPSGELSPKLGSESVRRCAGSMTDSSAPSAALHTHCGRSACPRVRRRRERNLIC